MVVAESPMCLEGRPAARLTSICMLNKDSANTS